AAVDPRHLQRFQNEAQAAAQLHHPHIVPVYAVGAEAGVHFYAMQFIDGQSLAQLLTELRQVGGMPEIPCVKSEVGPDGGLPSGAPAKVASLPRTASSIGTAAISTQHATRRRDYFCQVAELVRQAADALEYAHQVGVVHRDVKPANLVLDATGRLWVTD